MKYLITILVFIVSSFTVQAQSVKALGNGNDGSVKIIKFYPNPASSIITFEFEKGVEKNYTFHIFNFMGKRVFETQNVSSKTVINLTDYYRGIYFFHLKDKLGNIVESGKFAVAK